MKKCEALTKKGTQCSRNAVNDNLCTQHGSMKKVTKKDDPEPWDVFGFPVPKEQNGSSVIQAIRTLLKRGPTKTDRDGYIYIYYLDSDKGLSYYKIGRTVQKVRQRLKQWKGSKLKYASSTQHNQWVEQLIFKYLTYCRIHRYERPDGKGYHSVYQQTGEVVPDSQQWKGDKLCATSKHIEWFIIDYQEVKHMVRKIVDAAALYKRRKNKLHV